MASFTRRELLAGSIATAASFAGGPVAAPRTLEIPWSRRTFVPEEDCAWQAGGQADALAGAGPYIAPPADPRDWQRWLAELRRYRAETRAHAADPAVAEIAIDFRGVRAWVRTDRRWAYAADLRPGERIALVGEARHSAGNRTLCLAFDRCAREPGAADAAGPWRGWSEVVATATVDGEGEWRPFRIDATVPAFDADAEWLRPIMGMDATHDPTPGANVVRRLRLAMPWNARRVRRLAPLSRGLHRPAAFVDAEYRRPDLAWTARSFVCGFIFVYDRAFWDPGGGRYRVRELCADARGEFGGYDSVILWHAYPRIGADERSQFDFWRDMPGGLAGLRGAVDEFHRQGVKVVLPYLPWDTSTRREGRPDAEALAAVVAAVGADGVFHDTGSGAPPGLRAALDRARKGVAIEPEGTVNLEELEHCTASWAQWFPDLPGVGVLRLKWIEQRHMQHQVRRWSTSHRQELAAAWLNGSGVVVWENVFGSWNPWQAEDRAALRRMGPVLRCFAGLLSRGEWLPCWPTEAAGVRASAWQQGGVRLWTLWNEGGRPADGVVLEAEQGGARFYDVWRGQELAPEPSGRKARVAVPLDALGAVLAVAPGARVPGLEDLLAAQRALDAGGPAPSTGDPHVWARSVVEPAPPPVVPGGRPADTRDTLAVGGGARTFTVTHQLRECGCYPDPGTPPERQGAYLSGERWAEPITHHVRADLAAFRIDVRPVTNAEFERFVREGGYRPLQPERLLAHWGGAACPAALRDRPVAYVDLTDARAYAAWAGRRLPTEWEWQAAAEEHGHAFERGEVWEWTESERDDGHTRFVMLRGGCRWVAPSSGWYFPGGAQPAQTHAKFILLHPGLDRCSTIGFRCVLPT